MKKINLIIPMLLVILSACNNESSSSSSSSISSSSSSSLSSSSILSSTVSSTVEPTFMEKLTSEEQANLSVQGYAADGIKDFAQYIDTPAYRKVSNEDEFISALLDAKYEYDNVWNEETNDILRI